MRLLRAIAVAALCLSWGCTGRALGQAEPAAAPSTQPGQTRKLAHMTVDVPGRQVRVEAESIAVDAPLEFFCVVNGGPEHEAVLRSPVKPSDLHLGLLMLGLKPGSPVRYSQSADKWFPPHGPPVHLHVEWKQDGQTRRLPAHRLMRHVQTKKEMPATTWIFAGSRVMEDGNYAADVTGYLVSVVNFELTVIDVPDLRSNANELLEWEVNTDLCPPAGTAVTLIFEPAGGKAAPAGEAAADAAAAGPIDAVLVAVAADGSITMDREPVTEAELSERLKAMQAERPTSVRISAAAAAPAERVTAVVERVRSTGVTASLSGAAGTGSQAPAQLGADEQRLAALRQRWEKAVQPNRAALRTAAQSHYEVIGELREEQQRLIDEADRIQRLIDELEREYQDITTPRPVQ